MAQEGMEHWRRAVRWTFAAIFAVSLAGGLVGSLTRERGRPRRRGAAIPPEPGGLTVPPPRPHPMTAARGAATRWSS